MKNRNITKDEINKITDLCKIREKAFFTIMRQSGLPPHIIKQLKIKNIEEILEPYAPAPYKINLPQEIEKNKCGKSPTFIGKEAINYLKQYLEPRKNPAREDLLFTIKNNPQKEINTKDVSRTFKIKAQKYEKTKKITHENIEEKPNELQLYKLIKFYRKNAKDYLKEIKNNPDKDDEFYKKLYKEKAMPNLEIEIPTATELKTRIEKIENMIPSFKQDNNEHEKLEKIKDVHAEAQKNREYIQSLKENPEEAEKEYERIKNEEIQNLTNDIINLQDELTEVKKRIENLRNMF
jgi:hypothetical protein